MTLTTYEICFGNNLAERAEEMLNELEPKLDELFDGRDRVSLTEFADLLPPHEQENMNNMLRALQDANVLDTPSISRDMVDRMFRRAIDELPSIREEFCADVHYAALPSILPPQQRVI